MKQSFTVICVMGCLMFFLWGCGGVSTAPSQNNLVSTTEVAEEEGHIWVVNFYRTLCDQETNSYNPVIEIRNELDRNITLDFDGPSHYVVSIGDKKTRQLKVEPGTYKIMASSPGLKFVPRDYGITVDPYCVYTQKWTRTIRRTTYRK